MKLEAYYETDDQFELLETLDLQKATVIDVKSFIDKYAFKFYNHSIYLEDDISNFVGFVSQYLRRIETEEEIEEILNIARRNNIEELRTYLHDWLA